MGDRHSNDKSRAVVVLGQIERERRKGRERERKERRSGKREKTKNGRGRE
jgi:hypothetical protein